MHSPGCAKIILTALAILVSVLFVLCSSATLSGQALLAAVKSPQNFTLLVQQPGLIQQSRSFFARQLVNQIEKDDQSIPLLSQVPPATMQLAVETLFSDSWVETAVIKTASALEAWMAASSSQPYPAISFDLTPIKTYLQTPQGEQDIQGVIQAIPACTQGLTLGDLFNLSHLTCLPAGIDLAPLAPILAGAVAGLIPDQVSFSEIAQQGIISQGDIAVLEQIRSDFRTFHAWMTRGIWVSLLSLAVFIGLQIISGRRILKVTAWLFDSAGLFSPLLAGGVALFTQPLIDRITNQLLTGTNAGWQPIISGFLADLGHQVVVVWVLEALGLLLAGIFLHLLNLLVAGLHKHFVRKEKPL